jgi:hypothetical protein
MCLQESGKSLLTGTDFFVFNFLNNYVFLDGQQSSCQEIGGKKDGGIVE